MDFHDERLSTLDADDLRLIEACSRRYGMRAVEGAFLDVVKSPMSLSV